MKEILKPEVSYYQLTELIGEGLSSCVYQATRTDSRGHSSQIVAIKMLKSQQHIQFLINEFETLCRVRSPHCVSVLGWENFEFNSALILEFVDGVSLEQLVQSRSVNLEVLDELTRQIQLGLAELRTQGLCHGDLSPGNVLVDTQGIVRLVDFGLANWTARENFGTPRFLAPERWKRATPSFAADLYALGLIRQYVNGRASSDSLLKLKARHRRPLNIVESSKAQGELSELVHQVLKERVKKPMVTQSLATVPLSIPASRSLYPWVKSVGLLGVFVFQLLPILPRGEVVPSLRPASVEIRSRRWLQVSLNDHDLGYAPISLRTIDPGLYRMKWRMAQAGGMKLVRFSEGEHKVLTEADILRKNH